MAAAPIRAAAAIYSWGETADPAGGNYPSLGIRGGWNCLYLFNPGSGPTARMVPARSDTACATRTANEGKRLRVVVHAASPEMKASDIPAVARWEWGSTPAGETNVIWIRWGDRACEIGPDDFTPEPELPDSVQGERARAHWQYEGGSKGP